MDTIQKARLNDDMTRKEFAKSISEFAIKRFDLTPDTTRECSFDDMKDESPEYQKYAQLACQLGIMGLQKDGTPNSVFNPNKIINRVTVATSLSRIMFGDKYNVSLDDKTTKRYTLHMQVLNRVGVLKKTMPELLEKRIYVFLMMYRADKTF